MKQEKFWSGFAAGAGAAAAGVLGGMALWKMYGSRTADNRVLRLEKSVQIGSPVAEVFSRWSDFDSLQQLSNGMIEQVRRFGNRSHWIVNVDGRQIEWDAEVVQFIPNQAIGWKSISGPKHTGRINFSPIENDTLVHVTMNYAPPLGIFSRALAGPIEEEIEANIEKALREFKSSLEGKGGDQSRATGTFGNGNTRFNVGQATGSRKAPEGTINTGDPAAVDRNPVDYTRPQK